MLCGLNDTRASHSKLYCQKYENRICGMKHLLYIYALGLLDWVVKKLAISWIMPSLALLLHKVLSMIACSYMIRFNMYSETSVTG